MRIHKDISIDKLYVSQYNIRKGSEKTIEGTTQTIADKIKFNSDSWRALKDSILENGVIEDLYVTEEDDGSYSIFKGQRRFLAVKELISEGNQMRTLPCLVVDKMDKADILKEQLIELLKRDPSSIDIGIAILDLAKIYGTMKGVALKTGMAEDELNYYIVHLNLNPPETVEDAIELNRLASRKIGSSASKIEAGITSDQIPYWLEWKKEFPNENITILNSKFQVYWSNSRPYTIRVDVKHISKLLNDAKKKGKTPRKLIEESTNCSLALSENTIWGDEDQ
jgi:hypothetical protein